jgi:hypothetical protein
VLTEKMASRGHPSPKLTRNSYENDIQRVFGAQPNEVGTIYGSAVFFVGFSRRQRNFQSEISVARPGNDFFTLKFPLLTWATLFSE